jgi:hypothetical protein
MLQSKKSMIISPNQAVDHEDVTVALDDISSLWAHI